MIMWYIERYRAEKRVMRRRMRGISKPWTGRGVLVIACLLFAVALWVAFPPALAETYVITAEPFANVREAATTNSADLGDLESGETVEGSGYSGGWVQVAVSLEEANGWVREDLLTLEGVSVGKYVNISGGQVRVRRAPDSDSVVVWLPAGESITVIRWVAVGGKHWAVTRRGYVDGDCLGVSE